MEQRQKHFWFAHFKITVMRYLLVLAALFMLSLPADAMFKLKRASTARESKAKFKANQVHVVQSNTPFQLTSFHKSNRPAFAQHGKGPGFGIASLTAGIPPSFLLQWGFSSL